MDEGPSPKDNKRMINTKSSKYWYCYSNQFDEQQPPNFSLSSPFVNTIAFMKYWTEQRGIVYETFPNTFDGRDEMLLKIQPGDVFVFFDTEGNVEHIGLITGVKENDAFFCANSNDRSNFSIYNINGDVYPELGIFSMP